MPHYTWVIRQCDSAVLCIITCSAGWRKDRNIGMQCENLHLRTNEDDAHEKSWSWIALEIGRSWK